MSVRSVSLVLAATAAALASSALVASTPALGAPAPVFSRSILVRAPRLSEALALDVHAGMTREAITSLIGTPVRTMRFPLSGTTAWDYDFMDSWGYASELSVIFNDDGVVVGKVSSRNDY